MDPCRCSQSVLKVKSLRFPSPKYRVKVTVLESLQIHQNIQTWGSSSNPKCSNPKFKPKNIVNKEAGDGAEVLKEDTLVK